MDYSRLWETLESHFQLGSHSIHGPTHWRRVESNAIDLAHCCQADVTVAKLFAVFHDAQRWNESTDPEHGFRGAELAITLHGELFKVSDEQLDSLVYACHYHNHGRTPDDLTIGCCWDADRLDLPRVGIRPRSRFMSTAEGKRRATNLTS